MPRRLWAAGVLSVCALLLWGDLAGGGRRGVGGLRQAGMQGDGNAGYINIIVREIRVTPIHAHVGDVIKIEMVTEDRGDLVPNTVDAKIYAGEKIVASKLVTFGYGGDGERIRRETFLWNTGGFEPGRYRIKGEVFLFTDASPFDNSLEVAQPLVLLPGGAAFPPGVAAGGVGLARDPRYKPAARSPKEDDGGATGTGGY